MSDAPSFFERLNNWLKQSITIRLITIFILILLLLIPVGMVQDLISERESRQAEAVEEVSDKWGRAQTVSGPVLTVPYRTVEKVYDNNDPSKQRTVESKGYAHFLPEMLDVRGTISPEKRYRGIFEVIVYNASLDISVNFPKPDFEEWKVKDKDILWDEAFIAIGLSDLRSIQKNVTLQKSLNGKEQVRRKKNEEESRKPAAEKGRRRRKHERQAEKEPVVPEEKKDDAIREWAFSPGVSTTDIIEQGISVKPKAKDAGALGGAYTVKLNFNGSSGLSFIPLGKITRVNLTSRWQSPSFEGAFLPDQRVVNDDGFQAVWEVLHLNRPYPQAFQGTATGIAESAFGVNLMVPVDEYQKSTRSAKYAALFITLTFILFFFVQVLNRVRIHPVQYIIVGLALCVFYTLLIALSEHMAFSISYLIASVAIIAMITMYARAMFHDRKITRIIGLLLLLLYLFIFSIIQMEDYALLMGSVGLFIVLAVIMYLSRKIDWFGLGRAND
jgi:inner membrane protein